MTFAIAMTQTLPQLLSLLDQAKRKKYNQQHVTELTNAIDNSSWRNKHPLNPRKTCPTCNKALGSNAHVDHHPIHLVDLVHIFLMSKPTKNITPKYLPEWREWHELNTSGGRRRYRCVSCNVRDNRTWNDLRRCSGTTASGSTCKRMVRGDTRCYQHPK